MFDVAAYSLLKRGVEVAGGASGSVIVDARIENGELILITEDGKEINCGALPTGGVQIDDANISTETTWSSARIVEYRDEINEQQMRVIALDVTEKALSEFVPELIIGGNAETALSYIVGGGASFNEDDTLEGMDADEEPIGVKFDFGDEYARENN